MTIWRAAGPIKIGESFIGTTYLGLSSFVQKPLTPENEKPKIYPLFKLMGGGNAYKLNA